MFHSLRLLLKCGSLRLTKNPKIKDCTHLEEIKGKIRSSFNESQIKLSLDGYSC